MTKDDIVHFRDDVYDHDDDEVKVSGLSPMQTAARSAGGFVLQSAETKPMLKEVSYLDSR